MTVTASRGRFMRYAPTVGLPRGHGIVKQSHGQERQRIPSVIRRFPQSEQHVVERLAGKLNLMSRAGDLHTRSADLLSDVVADGIPSRAMPAGHHKLRKRAARKRRERQ